MGSVVEEYERILAMREEDIRNRCGRSGIPLQARPLDRVVENTDGTRLSIPTSKSDPTSSEFQGLFGRRETLTDSLGIGGVRTNGMIMDGMSPFVSNLGSVGGSGCPTGATGCNPDPYFHFPDLQKDSGDCLYIPTFTDVPITLSMAAYFVQAFLKEVSPDKILEDVDSELKDVFNKIVEGNLFFNYIPIAVIIIVLVWVMVIHGLFDWKAGLLLTFVFIAILWLGYLLLDLTVRENVSTVATKTTSTVKDSFSLKNEDILGNLLKGYYTAVNHMILPETAICGDSPTGGSTGTFGSCGCFDTGKQVTIESEDFSLKIPVPSLIINDQIKTGGDLRCVGIDNSKTLLPTIDRFIPCIKDIKDLNLSNISNTQKEKLANCFLDSLPSSVIQCSSNTKNTIEEKLNCLGTGCEFNRDGTLEKEPALCSIVNGILDCTILGRPS